MANASRLEQDSPRARTFAALRNLNYRRFYVGQGISLTGSWLQGAAINWIVFEKTRSESMLGVVGAASLLPGLVVGLFAGFLADRVIPKRMILLMQVAQMGLAFCLALLVGSGVVQIWHMMAVLALTRICVTFEMPCRQVFLYEIVGRADLSNAIALNSGLFNASRVIGPALAGAIYAAFGGTACFALNGVTFIAAISAVLAIRLPTRPRTHAPKGMEGVLEGFTYVRSDRQVAVLFVLMTVFGIVGMGYDSMVPAYATRVVGTGVRGYSLLLASSGAGATFGAFFMAFYARIDRKERLVMAGLFVFAAFLSASALIPPMFGAGLPWARLITASGCLFGLGFGAVLFYSAAQTIIQGVLPDHLRGRVMAIWLIAFSGSVPLGALWTGQVAFRYGVPFAMECSASLCVVVGIAGIMAWRSARNA